MVSPETTKHLRFYDPGQVPDYKTLVNRPLTPEEQDRQWRNREMTSCLCWKPYFHNPKLPASLRGVKIPTLIVWGKHVALERRRRRSPADPCVWPALYARAACT
jgi:hypothetical protein